MLRRFFLTLATFTVCLVSCFSQEAGDDSTFVEDLTYPDGTKVKAGQTLDKKWKIKNTGSVTWKDRYLVAVESTYGQGDLKTIKKTEVPATKPGETCVIQTTLKAPEVNGKYKVTFKMVDKDGKQCFPNKKGVYIEVVVE